MERQEETRVSLHTLFLCFSCLILMSSYFVYFKVSSHDETKKVDIKQDETNIQDESRDKTKLEKMRMRQKEKRRDWRRQ